MLQNTIETRILAYNDKVLGAIFPKKTIKNITIADSIKVELKLGFPLKHSKSDLIERLTDWLSLTHQMPIQVEIETFIDAHHAREDLQGLRHIKNIIAVASGKGGVGKSMVAVNLALALAREGASVGLLDADIYGPSQPEMLGTSGKRPALVNGLLQPIVQHGIQSMSIAYLVDQHAPLVWRGPMIGKAMQQMLHDTEWQALDYLIIDLPPGTGDIQLTLCQKIPVSGAIIVTTPQDLALVDVRRACEMFTKLNVPILGVIENMSTYHCPNCGHEEKIFGEGGAKKLMAEYHLKMLGQIPLHIRIREMTDHGAPPVLQDETSDEAKIFYDIALRTTATLSMQNKDYSNIFPKIVVETREKDNTA